MKGIELRPNRFTDDFMSMVLKMDEEKSIVLWSDRLTRPDMRKSPNVVDTNLIELWPEMVTSVFVVNEYPGLAVTVQESKVIELMPERSTPREIQKASVADGAVIAHRVKSIKLWPERFALVIVKALSRNDSIAHEMKAIELLPERFTRPMTEALTATPTTPVLYKDFTVHELKVIELLPETATESILKPSNRPLLAFPTNVVMMLDSASVLMLTIVSAFRIWIAMPYEIGPLGTAKDALARIMEELSLSDMFRSMISFV